MSKIEDVESIIKQRGFIWKSSEIYGGISGFYDYGHLGTLMKRRFEDLWREYFLSIHPRFFEISPSLIMPKQVFKASGHLDHFTDPIVKCVKCDFSERADQILEDQLDEKFEGVSEEELTELIKKHNIKCPKCGGSLEEVSKINLMFPLKIGPFKETKGFLRSETAQGAYMNFSREFKSLRKKLPMGLAVIGKAFRNEISPRQGVFRMREFNQAELQIFLDPENINKEEEWNKIKDFEMRATTVEHRNKIKKVSCQDLYREKDLPKKYIYFMLKVYKFYSEELGYPKDRIRFFELDEEEKSFYNKLHWDFEIKLESIGDFEEVCGVHYRTDYDLSSHEDESGESQEVFFEGRRIIPHVIEVSFGVDRNIYSLIETFYQKKDKKRILSLPPSVSPFQCAVFPLVTKDGLGEKACEVYKRLKKHFECVYDDSGSIGKRYARQDEIGTPLCITIDYDTMEDNTLTVRNRDTSKQIRISIDELKERIEEFFEKS